MLREGEGEGRRGVTRGKGDGEEDYWLLLVVVV